MALDQKTRLRYDVREGSGQSLVVRYHVGRNAVSCPDFYSNYRGLLFACYPNQTDTKGLCRADFWGRRIPSLDLHRPRMAYVSQPYYTTLPAFHLKIDRKSRLPTSFMIVREVVCLTTHSMVIF